MHSIIDSPYFLGDHADRLFAEGVRTVIRYYNHRNSTTFPSKCLTRSEFTKLTAAGLQVGVVFEQRGGAGGFLDDFSRGKGRRDGERAVELAAAVGQPDGSAIYFGVDHDFAKLAELNVIERYFAEIAAVLEGRFRVGVYGSGAVCKRLKAAGLASLFWLPASMGWTGSKAFLASQEWTLFQKFQELQSEFGQFDYDGNLFNPAYADFGQFGSTIAAVEPHAHHFAEPVAVFHVIARDGLRLRGGPGEQFDVLRTLPFGTVLYGIGNAGEWLQVDVNGDGLADGYMFARFLEPLSGGVPMPVGPLSATPYNIAQDELAKDVTEVAGRVNNPRIVMYHATTLGGAEPDETAWCSSFVNYCVEQAGLKGTDSKAARSWHDDDWGSVVSDPVPGDLVVWSRRSSTESGGHVGFFVDKVGDNSIRVLGGNQSNRVRISTYPRKGTMAGTRYELLSFRR